MKPKSVKSKAKRCAPSLDEMERIDTLDWEHDMMEKQGVVRPGVTPEVKDEKKKEKTAADAAASCIKEVTRQLEDDPVKRLSDQASRD